MRTIFFLIATVLFSCSTNTQLKPPSAQENSTERSQLKAKISFTEQYVTFDRSYGQLEYDIAYYNNEGGLVRDPSDWDIKILAVVPNNEIARSIPSEARNSTKEPPEWLFTIPGNIATENITEWYELNGVEIDVDLNTSTIAYRNTTL